MSAPTNLQVRGRLLRAGAIIRTFTPLANLGDGYRLLVEAIATHANEEFTPGQLAEAVREIVETLEKDEGADFGDLPRYISPLWNLLMDCTNVEQEGPDQYNSFETLLYGELLIQFVI
jgi:hypothetical protein